MIRNFIGILFFNLSGLTLIILNLFVFIDFSSHGFPSSVFLGVTGIIFLIFHGTGLLFYRKLNWKQATGITLLCSGIISLLTLLTFICMRYSTTMKIVLDKGSQIKFDLFTQYTSGILFFIFYMALGGFLYQRGHTKLSKHMI